MRQRPDPDALLKRITPENRMSGELKIYLGMAAGVGKTFSMLSDATIEKSKGVDVVAGYVEPHGRIETEQLVEQFEILPVLDLQHRGLSVKEFDLAGALKRNPSLILVDELAHTNVQGSRHPKRWMDVFELLEAGIDVYTTLNIQHLESLNDIVSSITGVHIRETVPDSVLARADRIEIIDLPPDELIERLKSGKIYPQSKVQEALTSFFTQGNLLALRELALRKAAEKIGADILKYRSAQNVSEIWATNERVLVAVAPSQFAKRLIRSAARIAAMRHSDLIAVTVDTPKYQFLREQDKVFREEAIVLAEKLGAQIERRTGSDIIAEVLTVANERNASLIVVGKPIRNRFRELMFGSVADELIRRSGRIDIHLITGEEEDATVVPITTKHSKPRWFSIGFALVVISLCTIICRAVYQQLELSNLIMIYLLGVVFISSRSGRLESTIAAILSVLCFDYFFVPPRFSFTVSNVQYLITFFVMLITALLLSTLTIRVRLQSQEVGTREQGTRALYEFGKFLLTTKSVSEITERAQQFVFELFNLDSCLFVAKGHALSLQTGSHSQFELHDSEFAVARWVSDRGESAGTGTDTLPGSHGLYLPLSTARRVYGVIGVSVEAKPLTVNEKGVLELLTQQVAMALEKRNLEEEFYESRIKNEKESLRNTLLSALSHDLRTPLTTIQGSAATLLESSAMSVDKRRTLTENIVSESKRLGNLIRNMMDISKLELGEVSLRKEWNALDELLSSALDKTEHLLKGKHINLVVNPNMPLVEVDAVFIEQVFINILENIAHHASSATHIALKLYSENSVVHVRISDDGPGVPNGSESKIFEKGYTTRLGSEGGLGLGLALCKRVMELHGGTIVAENSLTGGLSFILSLPIKPVPEMEYERTEKDINY